MFVIFQQKFVRSTYMYSSGRLLLYSVYCTV